MDTKQTGSTKQQSTDLGANPARANDVIETVYMDIHDVLAVHGVLATKLGISTHDIISLFDNLEKMKWDQSRRHGALMALLTTGLMRARSCS